MTKTLVHISDLHFGDPKGVLNRDDVARVVRALLQTAGPGALLLLSGDISFKGEERGYAEASEALSQAVNDVGFPRNQIVVCPGNHDVVVSAPGGSPFSAFDAWSAAPASGKAAAGKNILSTWEKIKVDNIAAGADKQRAAYARRAAQATP